MHTATLAYRIDTTESGKFSVVYRLWAGYFGRAATGPFNTYAAAHKWAAANIDDDDGERIA